MPPFSFQPNPEIITAIDACRGSLTREQFVAAKIKLALNGDLPVFAHPPKTKSKPRLAIQLEGQDAMRLAHMLTCLDMRPTDLFRRIVEAACAVDLTNITKPQEKPKPSPAPTLERPKPLAYQKPAERSFIPLSEITARMGIRKPPKEPARRQSGPLKIEQEPLTEAQLEVYTRLCAELCEAIDPREPTEEELEQLLAKATQG